MGVQRAAAARSAAAIGCALSQRRRPRVEAAPRAAHAGYAECAGSVQPAGRRLRKLRGVR